MKKQLLLVTSLAAALIAAAPAPKPIVTLERISAVTGMSGSTRTVIAPYVTAFDAGLQRMAVLHKAHASADREKRAQLRVAMKAVHDECHAQYAAIVQHLDPEQLRAFHEYLHAQLEAAGIPFMVDHDAGHEHH